MPRRPRWVWRPSPERTASPSTGAGPPTVLYNEARPPHRIRWTLAHEAGHILLGPVSGEREAHYAAEQPLMPAAVLARMGARTASDIARLCGVSPDAAALRVRDLDRHLAYQAAHGYTPQDAAFLRQFGLSAP